ncbi:hypothetical protein [Coleofasciculus sp. H7-2]|uniref:hypothetical protein n=1 Tax=Coleofasciculus sp. H7-2 TaxID=3351545 RepID=UPI0036718A03
MNEDNLPLLGDRAIACVSLQFRLNIRCWGCESAYVVLHRTNERTTGRRVAPT